MTREGGSLKKKAGTGSEAIKNEVGEKGYCLKRENVVKKNV